MERLPVRVLLFNAVDAKRNLTKKETRRNEREEKSPLRIIPDQSCLRTLLLRLKQKYIHIGYGKFSKRNSAGKKIKITYFTIRRIIFFLPRAKNKHRRKEIHRLHAQTFVSNSNSRRRAWEKENEGRRREIKKKKKKKHEINFRLYRNYSSYYGNVRVEF